MKDAVEIQLVYLVLGNTCRSAFVLSNLPIEICWRVRISKEKWAIVHFEGQPSKATSAIFFWFGAFVNALRPI